MGTGMGTGRGLRREAAGTGIVGMPTGVRAGIEADLDMKVEACSLKVLLGGAVVAPDTVSAASNGPWLFSCCCCCGL